MITPLFQTFWIALQSIAASPTPQKMQSSRHIHHNLKPGHTKSHLPAPRHVFAALLLHQQKPLRQKVQLLTVAVIHVLEILCSCFSFTLFCIPIFSHSVGQMSAVKLSILLFFSNSFLSFPVQSNHTKP